MMKKSDEQPHDGYLRCGAKTRAGTPCQQKAGWGTNRVGTGRCKLHGGKSSGPPKGNQNAFKHGTRGQAYTERRKQLMEILRHSRELIKSI